MGSTPLGHDDGGEGERAFLAASYLSYLVPSATDFKAETALRPSENPRRGKFESVDQRNLVFFGKRLAQRPIQSYAIVSHCLSVAGR